jgi:ADP-heptose:LPS heptosyltransferase
MDREDPGYHPGVTTPPLPPLADPATRRVALVRLRLGLGDLLCSAPALRALRRLRPDLHVAMVTWADMGPVVYRLGGVDEVLAFPGVTGIPEREPDPAGWRPFLAEAHARRFDLAVQCYGDNPVANDVTRALGARVRGGFAPVGWAPPAGLEHLHLPYPTDRHEVWRHLLLMERLGVPLPDDADRLSFPTTEEEETTHRALLLGHGLRTGEYAVLHPGASSPSRRWPTPSYAEVAGRLHRDGLRVVVTGTPHERDLVDELLAQADCPVLDLCGRTSLAGMALLLRDSAVLVGNDTGTAHLAAAVGARRVTIFQPGDPRRWGHEDARSRVLTPDVACAPCPHLECPIDLRCSTATTPDDVLAAARSLLGPALPGRSLVGR